MNLGIRKLITTLISTQFRDWSNRFREQQIFFEV